MNKEEIAGRFNLFLDTFFSTLKVLEMEFYLLKDYNIMLKDKNSDAVKKFSPEEFHQLYEKWFNSKQEVN